MNKIITLYSWFILFIMVNANSIEQTEVASNLYIQKNSKAVQKTVPVYCHNNESYLAESGKYPSLLNSDQNTTSSCIESSTTRCIDYNTKTNIKDLYSYNYSSTPIISPEVRFNNEALCKEKTTESTQINEFESILLDTLPAAADQQIIQKILAILNKLNVCRSLTIYGPKDAYFYFEDLNLLCHALERKLPQSNSESQMPPALSLLISSSNSKLNTHPARLKAIRMPFFSPVSGHRIASLRFKSISTVYKRFGPFRIPMKGAILEGAELIITSP